MGSASYAETIAEGQYRIKIRVSEEISSTASGTRELAEQAVEAFITACLEAEDDRIRAWATELLERSKPQKM